MQSILFAGASEVSQVDGLDLKIARLRAGLKQYELAQRAGLRPNELSLIESGHLVPARDKLERIRLVLGGECADAREAVPA